LSGVRVFWHPRRFFLRKDLMNLFTAFFLAACALASLPAQAQPREIVPQGNDAILEKLGPRLSAPKAPNALIPAVRQAIELSRQTADPRYLGQAQALIGALWSSSQAGYELLTLQATIEQSRHEFAQAKLTLQLALKQPTPSNAQAWLTLATIERVQGNYAAAEAACKSIITPAAQLYAKACLLETQSLRGKSDAARQGFAALLREQPLAAQQAWLQSLMAENEERAGDMPAAMKLYAVSLSLDNDGYTAVAYADALLRGQQAALAISALQNQPASDSVLIRRATAYRQLGDPQFQRVADELSSRFAAAGQRGESAGHAREKALYELHVKGNAQSALSFAQSNLKLQQEPVDWLIAIQSAAQLGQSAEKTKLLQAAAKTGLKDARLK
jgi:tetratricopeptide (TPR) repeat protein